MKLYGVHIVDICEPDVDPITHRGAHSGVKSREAESYLLKINFRNWLIMKEPNNSGR
jgi:hypothetical protein